MNYTINKDKVSKRFEKSIHSYNNEALVQKSIAKELVWKIMNCKKEPFHRVLEIGCGTGFLTHELLQNFHPEDYVINDLSDLMQSAIAKINRIHEFTSWSFMAGDAEEINFPGNFDLVISASAFQWFQNMETFISSISCSINKDGILAFSTFGTENFREIKSLQNITLNYPQVEELKSWLSPNFTIIECSEEIVPVYFSTPYEVLKHIKLTGVNALNNKHWNKRELFNFEDRYKQYYTSPDNTVSLTYHPIIIIARKK